MRKAGLCDTGVRFAASPHPLNPARLVDEDRVWCEYCSLKAGIWSGSVRGKLQSDAGRCARCNRAGRPGGGRHGDVIPPQRCTSDGETGPDVETGPAQRRGRRDTVQPHAHLCHRHPKASQQQRPPQSTLSVHE